MLEKEFQKKIKYEFKDISLLTAALTHTSYANEHGTVSFERLEFLGDSILGFVVAENLYFLFPNKSEGDLSKIRAGIVCEDSLAELAKKTDIPNYIFLGHGEEMCNGRQKSSIISDVVEAVIAAIYLDSDFETAKAWINKMLPTSTYKHFRYQDWKTILQERFKRKAICYQTEAVSELCNEKAFSSVVTIDNVVKGKGVGNTKKAAEQKAAQNALNQ